MANNFKNFTELDFDRIKDSLKTFLKEQTELQDYNFEGSTINTLLNLFAYNTQYNAFYQNMHSSERFLGVAQRRENIVQAARNLGYTPQSAKGSTASLNITITPESGFVGTTILLPKDTIFTSKSESGETLQFYSADNVIVTQDGAGDFITTGYTIFQGKKFTYREIFKDGQTGVVIPNPGVDVDKITVVVKDSAEEVGIEYEYVGADNIDITRTEADSTVYFLEEVAGEKFRVYFGDNVVGNRPSVGQLVEITYYTSIGDASNGAFDFALSSTIADVDTISITNSPVSATGRDLESNASVEVNAPFFFSRQNRAVTTTDVRTLVPLIYPEAYSVSSWGGQDNDPVALGWVFISVIKDGFDDTQILTLEEKELIEDQLKNKYNVVTIFPQVIDPEFTYIEITSNVNFDSNILNPGSVELKAITVDGVFDYGLENFSKFLTTFRYSKVVSQIDSLNQSIVSNDTDVRVYTEEKFINDFKVEGETKIGVAIKDNSVVSSYFTYDGVANHYLIDDPVDNAIDLYRLNAGSPLLVQADVATLDYTNGKAVFSTNLAVWDFDKVTFDLNLNPFKLYAEPLNRDFSFEQNQVPILRKQDIIVSVRDITEIV